jgi:hypothetical protein
MGIISWLAKIPDDNRLRFGFPWDTLARLSLSDLPKRFAELDLQYRRQGRRNKFGHYEDEYLPESIDLKAAFERVDKLPPSPPTQFFVRDNDLGGENRLYQPSAIIEFPDKPSINPIGTPYYSPTVEYRVPSDSGEHCRTFTWDKLNEVVPRMRDFSTSTDEKIENGNISEWRRLMYV